MKYFSKSSVRADFDSLYRVMDSISAKVTRYCIGDTSTRYDYDNDMDKISGGMPHLQGHEYVDLGLPSGTLWATCNLGASSPAEYGDYYAYGETETKEEYTAENTIWWNKYYILDLVIQGVLENNDGHYYLRPKYDAATQNWGNGWRMPTKEEFEELIENCQQAKTTFMGVIGTLFKELNGNMLFLSMNGRQGSNHNEIQSGFYRTASIGDREDHVAYDGVYIAEHKDMRDGKDMSIVQNISDYAHTSFTIPFYTGYGIRPVVNRERYLGEPNLQGVTE